MACVAEALGMIVPGTAGIPAPDSRLLAAAHEAGRQIPDLQVAIHDRPLVRRSFHRPHHCDQTPRWG